MGTMMRIGLTGGIAAGKSTVAARLKQLGALHIDYDALAHQIVEPGGVALPQIVAEFGPDALLADGTMNQSSEEERRAIADIVIDSTHPLPEMLAQVGEIYAGWCAGR